MLERIIGVFKLDRQTFAEIERDESATGQAVVVVAIVATLSVVGSLLGLLVSAVGGGGDAGATFLTIIGTFLGAFINWIIWSAITYVVGTQLFNGQATFSEMLRVIGFAYAPRMLAIIPCIGGIIGAIWSLIASYFAIKEGLDLDDTGTIVTILVGWLITVIIGFVLGLLGLGSAIGLGVLGGLFQ